MPVQPTAGGSLLNPTAAAPAQPSAGGSMLGAPQQQAGGAPAGPQGGETDWQQPVQGAGGFNTTGLQYGVQGSGQGVQGGMGPGQVDTTKIAGYQPGVTSLGESERYRQDAGDAYYRQATSRLDPRFKQEQSGLENQLANMGLSRGSEAWNNEMQRMAFNKNDAYSGASNQATMMAGQEAQRMQGMDINRGNFMNQAGQQGFQNNLASQDAQNRAYGQQFGQGMQAGNFNNAAQQQAWNQNMGQAQLNNQALLGQRGIDAQRESSQNSLAASQIGGQNQRYMADMQNRQWERDADYRDNQFNYNVGRNSMFDPYAIQNMAMQDQYPSGNQNINFQDPNVPGMGNPNTNANANQNTQQPDYGSMGGNLWNSWNNRGGQVGNGMTGYNPGTVSGEY